MITRPASNVEPASRTAPHGVYDARKAPVPVVKNPDECVDRCHGCGNRCPVGAITYVGDDTGWTPPKGKQKADPDARPRGCGDTPEKKIVVEYLYLDLHKCDRCIETDGALDEVMRVLTPALRLAGFEVEYNKIEMATAEIARQYRFLSSPTVRVNGRDICERVAENNCACCGEISGGDVDCRVFELDGQSCEVPPKEVLATLILRAVFAAVKGECSCGVYAFPENLRKFYEGKSRKSGGRQSNCC